MQINRAALPGRGSGGTESAPTHWWRSTLRSGPLSIGELAITPALAAPSYASHALKFMRFTTPIS